MATSIPFVDDNAARIELVINNDDPIELLAFAASIVSVAREYQASIQILNPENPPKDNKLVIVDVRKGSILLDIMPWIAPIIAEYEKIKPVVDFVKMMKSATDILKTDGGRLPDATTQRLKNLQDMVEAIASDSKGSLSMSAVLKDGDVLAAFKISRDEARKIQENASAQRNEIEVKRQVEYPGVVMRLHQSSISEATVGRKTNEKGIIERIDRVPRPLIYASDLAAQKIKNEILRSDGNPYQKIFVVDVDVELIAGVPRAYRIIEVKDIIDPE